MTFIILHFVFNYIIVYIYYMKKLLLLLIIFVVSKIGISQDTDFYNTYFEGNALLAKGQYDKAIEKYNEAIKLFPADYVYFNRGNANFKKGDMKNALLDYSITIKMKDSYAEAYFQRALVKSSTGDATSCDDFKKAVKLELEGAKEAFRKNCK